MKKNILITGVAGLFGVNFVYFLENKNCNVYGVDNLSGGYKDNLPANFNLYTLDLTKHDQILNKIIKIYNIDYVFHFAAYAAEGLSPFIRNFNYTNNLISSINVVNACINNNVKKLIFTSSMSIYGSNNVPFFEEQIPKPEDPYAISKYAVEMDIINAYNQFGLKYNIIRPHNVIGVYQNIWDKYRNVIGIWIRKVLMGENITIFGDGLQTRAFSDIKSYMQPLYDMMENHDNEIYNIGGDKEYTIKDAAIILKKIAKKYGYNPEIEHLEKRFEVKHAYSNHDKFKKDFNYYEETDFEEIIEKMFVWGMEEIKKNREIKKMNYEISKNIYNFWK